MSAQQKVTSADISMALRRRWGGQEATTVFEVAQGTGARANRHLDAVAMELWPSRGLALHGIEIKVSRSDFRREAKDPEKAEEVARFLDYFWIAAPIGIVPLEEVPSAWGLLEFEPSTTSLKIKKQAAKTEAQPISRGFMAAMMRASSRSFTPGEVDAALQLRRKKLDEEFDDRLKRSLEHKRTADSADADAWRKLVKAIGHDPTSYWGNHGLLEAVIFVMKSNLASDWRGIYGLLKAVKDFAAAMEAGMAATKMPSREEMDRDVKATEAA